MFTFWDYYHNKRLQYITLAVVIVLFVALILKRDQPQGCEILPGEPREVMQSTLAIQPLWGANFNIDSTRTRDLVSTDQFVIAAKYCGEVVAFELRTGEIGWKKSGVTDPVSLVIDLDNDSLYISEQQELTALSLSAGDTRWATQSNLFEHTSNPSYLLRDGRLVVWAIGRGLYLVNKSKGTILNRIDLPAGTVHFIDTIAFVKTPDSIKAVDPETGEELWLLDGLSGSWLINLYPEENLAVIQQNYTNVSPSLIALNETSGDILWTLEKRPIVSNIIAFDGVIYALDWEANLMMLDVSSGSELGYIGFDFASEKSEQSLNYSQISVHNDIISIYFQDTNNLSMYEVDLPE